MGQRYQIIRRRQDGRVEARDEVLQRNVLLIPASAPGGSGEAVHDRVTLDSREYVVVSTTGEDCTPRTSRRRRWICAAATLLVAVGVLGGWWLIEGRWDQEPLCIAVVMEPSGGRAMDSSLELVRSAIELGAVNGLLSRRNVSVVSGRQVQGISASLSGIARAVGADNVLGLGTMVAGNGRIRVLARLLGPNDTAIWTDKFEVPLIDAGLAFDSTAARVAGALRHRPPRVPAAPGADPTLYERLVRIRRDVRSGEASYRTTLEELVALSREAPSMTEAQSLAASMACYLFKTTGDRKYIEQARQLLDSSSNPVASDPRVLSARIEIAIATADLKYLGPALAALRRTAPGFPYLPGSEAIAAELAGEVDTAISILEHAISQRATWFDLVALGDLKARHGDFAGARADIAAASELAPDHIATQAKLAELELINGSPAEAERLLLAVISTSPRAHYVVNLAIAQLLQGRLDDAATRLAGARSLGYKKPILEVYQADIAHLGGDDATARTLYAAALTAFADQAVPTTPLDLANQAYCHARLGHRSEADQLINQALNAQPSAADIAFAASLALKLLGQDALADHHAQRARDLGLSESWFKLELVEPTASASRGHRQQRFYARGTDSH